MIAFLDCSTGVSGDKFLGALLDAGSVRGDFTAEHLSAILSMLAPEARVSVERVRSRGIAAVSVRVEAIEQPTSRTWASIRSMLEGADLSERVRETALAAFEALALAEAQAHGCDVDDVHFHEVGALDSILDVVGVCAGLETLGIDWLVVSPVATGWGTVETSHGVLPVPAPATAALLYDVPIVSGPARPDGSSPGELTTPTGAALVRAVGGGFGICPPMTPQLVGYGAGTRDIGNPNICRMIIGDGATPEIDLAEEDAVLLETNVDHISPEAAAFAAEQLLAEGALDVWQAPIVMKKGRAGFVFSVLARPGSAVDVAERIVALTGSLGVRFTQVPRLVAQRAAATVETPYGTVRYKIGPEGAEPRIRPEHEDVARIARETGRLYLHVVAELTELIAENANGL